MNLFGFYLRHYVIAFGMILISSSTNAQTTSDTTFEQARLECNKHSASEWDTTLNRCIQKRAAQEKRHEVEDCKKDPAGEEACYKKIASRETGISQNFKNEAKNKQEERTDRMMMMNIAYTAIAAINNQGFGYVKSACVSKQIFGITALAGIATDFYLKDQAKKKVSSLSSKYKFDAKSSANASQTSALEYLKEEQDTVASIASMEKKRNILLMLGYGAAAIMAAVELAPGAQAVYPDCYTPKPAEKPAPNVKP